MISVRSRLQQLSGNKWPLLLCVGLIIASCSPKVRTVTVQTVVKQPEKPVEKPIIKPVAPPASKVTTVSLLLPFGLDHLKPGNSYTGISLKEADIALAYYRGFKLALDSLTAKGFSYKLRLYDSRGDVATSHALAANPAIKASDLIIGPVFPGDLKAFSTGYYNPTQLIVSPLSPAPPATFKNKQLITIIPPLEYHAWCAALYITENVRPKKIFILRSGFSDENDYIIPFKKAIDSLGKKHIRIVEYTVLHGQLGALSPQLSSAGPNVFVVPANNQHFLTVTLNALDTLSSSFPVTLYGHPNWVNFSFLKTDLLERLDTHITLADRVNYKDAATLIFVQQFKRAYHTEPTAFAIKGFDEGLYLGQLLATDSLKDVSHTDFKGLHNTFHFQKKAGLGWVNTHVNLYKYANFELEKVE
jgi:ABC-type branched-subunit amino acid transport system substrate-binding protein